MQVVGVQGVELMDHEFGNCNLLTDPFQPSASGFRVLGLGF